MGGVTDQLPSFCELVDRFSLFNSSQASPCNTQVSFCRANQASHGSALKFSRP